MLKIDIIEKIRPFLNPVDLDEFILLFDRLYEISNSKVVLTRIYNSNDKEHIKDYIAEIKFALIFDGLDFFVNFEPLGLKGPDLLINKNNIESFVEIKRLRCVNLGPDKIKIEKPRLYNYGDIAKDTKKAFLKIIQKFPQSKYGNTILAIWNDDQRIEEGEIKQAVQELITDFNKSIISIPDKLLFILYRSDVPGILKLYQKWEFENVPLLAKFLS